MRPTDDELRELITAAYQVAIAPTVAAYRSGASDKKVYAPKLRRLMDALTPTLRPEAQEELRKRLDALDKADGAHEAWLVQKAAEAAERAKLRDTERPPTPLQQGA